MKSPRPRVEDIWNSVPLQQRMASHLTYENVGLVLQAIADHLEDGARWRFLAAALENHKGPEAAACLRVKGDAALTNANMTAMVDAARAALAA